MDPGKKSTSEIDKKLDTIKSKFDLCYKNWVLEKEKESSSQPGKEKESSSQPGKEKESSSQPGKEKESSSQPGNKRRSKANCVETEPELPDHKIHGFVNEKLFLKSYLLKQKESKEFKTLAIVGKYGVGKTTLCQSVFNYEKVKQAYLPRIWVSMYSKETKENEDPKIDVVKRILGSLGVEDEMLEHIKKEAIEEEISKVEAGVIKKENVKENELSRLLNALHLNLIGKKYLIVLDDVWEDNKWNERLDGEKNQQHKSHLSCGFPKECGGRVIVTTRDKCLAKKIVGEEENLQRLFPRSDEESIWNIYQDAVPDDVQMRMKIRSHAHALLSANRFIIDKVVDAGPKVNPKYPGRFKKELMDKSCGVPLAARMLAKIKFVEMEDIIKEINMDRKKSF